ncbi:MAG: acetyl-CoA carboxylase biotin carboxyl carrier protein subunit [Elusimicrobiota bacterium]
MNSEQLRTVVDWLKTTDLVEISFRKNGKGFALSTPDSPPRVSEGALPPSRFLPVACESVGVFQWGEPGQARRAEEGSSVAAGAVLGVVVSGSRTSTPVKAPAAGRVAKCFAQAGQAVEYGQPLFLLEPRP